MSMLTQDLLEHLCCKLGHRDAVLPLVKKLVVENWLDSADDLRYTPRERLENWGVPLKLVSEIYDALLEDEAQSNVNGINAWVQYSARPFIQRSAPFLLVSAFKSASERRTNPEEWAALRLQGAWRCRKARKQKLRDEVLDAFEEEDFSRKSEQEREDLRRQRALLRIARFVRKWKYRREVQNSSKVPLPGSGARARVAARRRSSIAAAMDVADKSAATAAPDGAQDDVLGFSIAKHLAHASNGRLLDCETTQLLVKFGKEMGRTKEEMATHIHRLVTLHWLEDIEDLYLVEDRHWAEWEMPERLVIRIKSELGQRREARVSDKVGGCSVGVSTFISRLFGWDLEESEQVPR